MPAFHRLDPDADARFLRAGQTDPLTRVRFRPTNAVVLCATCGAVSLRETWEALGGCPNGHDTAAPWDEAAALAAGDGAAGRAPAAPPRTRAAAPAPEPSGRRWLVPALVALGVAVMVVGALALTGQFADDEVPVETVPDTPAEPDGPEAIIVEVGEVEGELTDADFRTERGRYQDLYTFAADSSGRVLAFSLQSDDFLPDLTVEAPDGERVPAETVADDPDTGARTVAVRDLRGPGLYRVFVTSRRPEDTGAYVLRIRQEPPVQALAVGASVTATLGQRSERVEGFFRDRYRFQAAEGREHTVTVRSSAFAPTVELTGPGGAVRGESGRAGGSVTYTFTPERDRHLHGRRVVADGGADGGLLGPGRRRPRAPGAGGRRRPAGPPAPGDRGARVGLARGRDDAAVPLPRAARRPGPPGGPGRGVRAHARPRRPGRVAGPGGPRRRPRAHPVHAPLRGDVPGRRGRPGRRRPLPAHARDRAARDRRRRAAAPGPGPRPAPGPRADARPARGRGAAVGRPRRRFPAPPSGSALDLRMTEADDTIRVSKSRLREVKGEIDRLTQELAALREEHENLREHLKGSIREVDRLTKENARLRG